MTIALDHHRVALDLLRENGGSMRVQEVVARAVMPSVLVRPVFTALIAEKKVRLQGDDLYVLADLSTSRPAVEIKISASPPPPPPPPPKPEPAPMKTETKPEKGKRRCVRCEELLSLDQFPMRPGMVRAPRICVGCLPADETLGSPGDRARANLPPTRDQVPFVPPGPDAPSPPPNMETPKLQVLPGLTRALTPEYCIVEVEIHTTVRRYLEQLAATGLYGKNVEEVAQQLVVGGVRAAMLGSDKRA